MKKSASLVFLSLFLLALSFSPGAAQQQAEPEKPQNNLSLVDNPEPVDERVKTGFESITGKDAVTYLEFLSSDVLQGREAATREYETAARYAASMFSLWGILPAGDIKFSAPQGMFGDPDAPGKPERTYLQQVEIREILSSEGDIQVKWSQGPLEKTHTFQPGIDYLYSGSGTQSLSAPLVFAGYGIQEKSIKWDDYKNIDIKGKFVLIFTGIPGADDPDSPFNTTEMKKKYQPPRMMRRWTSPKIELARKLGAAGVLMIESDVQDGQDVPAQIIRSRRINDERPIFPGERRRMSLIEGKGLPMPWQSVMRIQISREMADTILGLISRNSQDLQEKIISAYAPFSFALEGVTLKLSNRSETRLVSSPNVLGYMEGSDPELKDEVVVIGAHLDHLGKRGDYIFNGADDNGSGSAGVMEIAEAFSKNPVKPKRSILFALWTAEEKGLLGSRYYVFHPFFPIDKTAACLNLDMISRNWDKAGLQRMSRMWGIDVDKETMEKIDVENFISLSFAEEAPYLGELLRQYNRHIGLSLHLRPSESAMGGSDHAPFAMSKIPWIFFFAAMTEDYHQPSDSVEKVNSELMEKIMRLTYLTAFHIADQE
ncbi:MAG: M20/M25/M40 family metallo-hydrolase [Candidatus Aminicenantes bacterium]